jgi:KTSC domain-containing protein
MTKKMIKSFKFDAKINVDDSSWISQIQYDPESLKLDVLTRTGAKYRYQGVGTDTFAKLVTASSSGEYFNAEIKGKFRSKKLRNSVT